MTSKHDSVRAIEWSTAGLRLLDQRRLPAEERYLTLMDVGSVAGAIRDMVVRGAPAIGIAAAYGVVLAAQSRIAVSPDNWIPGLEEDIRMLADARPTAVNLQWALERMRRCALASEAEPLGSLLEEACVIHQEDVRANHAMGGIGSSLIAQGDCVLTHCNTGSLATGGYGTALGVIRSAWQAGKLDTIYAGETRPWLQGARLTAWELMRDDIPVTLIVDSAAAFIMQQQRVQWVILGADRITANGDVINKIGTYSLAVNCRHHGVGFMVVAPLSTLDRNTVHGSEVPIEHRDSREVLSAAGRAVAAAGAGSWNPAFDVTPAGLVDYLVTERGVIRAPDSEKLSALWSG